MVISIRKKINFLKIIYKNKYAEKENLTSIEGRLLIAIYLFKKNDLDFDLPLKRIIMDNFKIIEKNLIIFLNPVNELISSGTIHVKNEENIENILDISMSSFEVNPIIKNELEKGNFFRFATKTKEIVNNLFAIADTNKKIIKFGVVENNISVNSYDSKNVELQEYDFDKKDLDDKLIIENSKSLEFISRDIIRVDSLETDGLLNFDLESNVIIPNDQFTKEYLELISIPEKKDIFNSILQNMMIPIVKNLAGLDEEHNISFTQEDILDFKEGYISQIYNEFYFMKKKNKIISLSEKDGKYLFSNLECVIKIPKYKKITVDELSENIMNNNAFNEFNFIDSELTKNVFFKFMGLGKTDNNFLIKIYDLGIIDEISSSEIKSNLSEGLLELLPDKKISSLIIKDKKKQLKPFLKTISKVMTDTQIYSYFKDIKEAKDSELLTNSIPFKWILKIEKFIVDKNDEEYIKNPDKLIIDLSEFENMIRAAKPFQHKNASSTLKDMKVLKSKLFKISIEEIKLKASQIRSRIEEFVSSENLMDSVPLGSFSTYVKKISWLNRKEIETIIKGYQESSNILHYNKENSEKDLNKVFNNLANIQKKLNRIFEK